MQPTALITLLAALPTAASAASASTSLYVAVDGDDRGDGLSVPTAFRSLHRAQLALRERAGPTSVTLLPGRHTLNRTLSLDATDSGRPERPVVWRAADPGQPTSISGGVSVTGWTANGTGVWSAAVPAELQGAIIRQLWVNGRRANRSRVDGHPLGCNITETGMIALNATTLSWGDVLNHGEIEGVWRHDVYWVDSRCGVEKVDGNTITMKQPCWNNSIHKPVAWESFKKGPDFFENVYAAFTDPGQWYYDRTGGSILYRPLPGEMAGFASQSVDVVVPKLERLVEGNGVAHHAWEGVTFEYATWLAPSSGDAFVDMQSGACLTGAHPPAGAGVSSELGNNGAYWRPTPGTVRFFGSHDLAFNNCTFTHLGAFGLDFRNGTQNVSVSRCTFTDTSAGGISMGQFDDYEQQDRKQWNYNFTIADNVLFDMPVEYVTTQPIFAGYIASSVIEHNHIYNSQFSGISIGWGWGAHSYSSNNTIRANHIQNVTNCHIYVLSPEEGSHMSRNHLDGLYSFELPALFMDQSSSGWNVSETVIESCGPGVGSEYKPTPSVLMNFGAGDIWLNHTWVKNCSQPKINFYGGTPKNNSAHGIIVEDYVNLSYSDPWPSVAQAVIDQAGVRPMKTDDLHAIPSSSSLIELDRRHGPPPHWVARTAAPGGGRVTLNAVLKPRNAGLLEEVFWNVSDPEHENYAHYWTWPELQAAFSPDTASLTRVTAWIHSIGGRDVRPSETDTCAFSLTYDEIKAAFNCTPTVFHMGEHELIRCAEHGYSVAAHIFADLAVVEGLIDFAAHVSAWSAGSLTGRAAARGVPEYHLPVPQGRLMYNLAADLKATAKFNAVAAYGPSYLLRISVHYD